MVRAIIAAVVVCVLMAILYYFAFLTPSVVMKAAVKHALATLSDKVNTKDHTQIDQELQDFFADDAKITLHVSFFTITQPEGAKPNSQDFDKATFITFIGNVIYPLTDYALEHPEIETLTANVDHSDDVNFTSLAWADDMSLYNGISVNTRVSANPDCKGTFTVENKVAKVHTLECNVVLRTVPKPGEEKKLQMDPQALGEYLR